MTTPTQNPGQGGPPPGWYADPDGSSAQRWWDGSAWTEHRLARVQAVAVGSGRILSGLRAPSRLIGLVALAATLLLAPAAGSATRTEKRLRAQVTTLRDRVADLADQRADLRTKIGELETTISGQANALGLAQKENARVAGENDQLRNGLPDAILAVPVEEFWRLVFTPARQKWHCDSYFSSGNYWSLSFDSGPC